MSISRVCVFCASSSQCDPFYLNQASILGKQLIQSGYSIVYGGGSTGLMGALADAAMAEQGTVLGVIPGFMVDVEWGHEGITELRRVDDMHERLKHMKQESDAFIVLPGGCGTLDELFQVLTWKRLSLHTGPVIIVNARGFFDPTIAQLQRCVNERFMNDQHAHMWDVVSDAKDVVDALKNTTPWDSDAIRFARPGG